MSLIVHIDGVDGSGKSTLLQHLLGDSRIPRCRPVPSLGDYLPLSGMQFGEWIRRTRAETIVKILLDSQLARLREIRSLADRDGVHLIDRGGFTVLASACAQYAAKAGVSLNTARAFVQERSAAIDLLPQADEIALVLESPSNDVLNYRLAEEIRDENYLRYSELLRRAFLEVTDGMKFTSLGAHQSVAVNTDTAVRTIVTVMRQ